MAAAAARAGSRRLFSTSALVARKLLTLPAKADALPSLFVPGLGKQTTIGGLREAFLKSGQNAHASSLQNSRWYMISSNRSGSLAVRKEYGKVLPSSIRPCASYSTQASENKPKQEKTDLTTTEDPFDAPTYNIPEKPVTFAEGASYSVVILAGLGVAVMAGYAVFKELIFEPKEYKIFGKALARVQSDSQVTAKIGYPVTGYGTESRNRAARQRIQNRVWTDEDGVEHVEVAFFIRGPHGAGKVFAEMFKDDSDRTWKFTFLLVEVTSPRPAQIMLESYIPA
jgi:import inner membrane translocase subunit TIM21